MYRQTSSVAENSSGVLKNLTDAISRVGEKFEMIEARFEEKLEMIDARLCSLENKLKNNNEQVMDS